MHVNVSERGEAGDNLEGLDHLCVNWEITPKDSEGDKAILL